MGLSAYRFMYVMESFETAAGALLYYADRQSCILLDSY
jgi:hypothetical protein